MLQTAWIPRPTGSKVFINPKAISSALTALRMLLLMALGFITTVDPSVSVSSLYIYLKINIIHTLR